MRKKAATVTGWCRCRAAQGTYCRNRQPRNLWCNARFHTHSPFPSPICSAKHPNVSGLHLPTTLDTVWSPA